MHTILENFFSFVVGACPKFEPIIIFPQDAQVVDPRNRAEELGLINNFQGSSAVNNFF